MVSQQELQAAEEYIEKRTNAISRKLDEATDTLKGILYLRMTPEIMAELAFQQINLIASRLTLTGQRDFYAKLQRYISEIQ